MTGDLHTEYKVLDRAVESVFAESNAELEAAGRKKQVFFLWNIIRRSVLLYFASNGLWAKRRIFLCGQKVAPNVNYHDVESQKATQFGVGLDLTPSKFSCLPFLAEVEIADEPIHFWGKMHQKAT